MMHLTCLYLTACFTEDKKEDEENLDDRALYPGAAITISLCYDKSRIGDLYIF